MVELQRITCKCCGEPLDISKAIGGVVKCAICDSVFVVAKKETTPKALSFLHIGESNLDTCKFDEAYTNYKKAAELDPNEPEAYFGMALAEFKVQYLRDISGEKPRLQPICHEVTDKKFTKNHNYKHACMLATAEQRAEYQREAQEIDYILGEFYRLKQSGLDYDCFICVKVTDDKTKLRTADYKDADDIYFSLRGKGYKPFFSERELGDVTGADYEARILYALYTSECMLVVCRDESYLQTPWVKNEYTRFLKLVNDEEKESDSITIAFNGKPIERLPGRKGKLQGIDLSKLSALSKIEAFVENHTPEARKKREEAVAAKLREAEEQRNRIKELEEQAERLTELMMNQLAEQDERKRQEDERRRRAEEAERERIRKEEDDRKRQEELARMQKEAEERARRAEEERERRMLEEQARQLEAMRKAEGERIAREKAEAERREQEREMDEDERIAFEQAEAARLAKWWEQAEAENIARERAEAERKKREEAERIIREKAEVERKAKEEAERIAREIAQDFEISNKVLNEKGERLNGVLVKYKGNKSIVAIPNNVTSIFYRAFSYCKSLTSITIPDSVTFIDRGAFEGCSGLTSITVEKGNKNYYSINNCIIEISSKTLIRGCKNSIIPKDGSVTTIGDWAFWGCSGLTSITIPNSVTSIGGHAFDGCSGLTSITIPNSVTSIGNYAFNGCDGLTNITIPNSVTTIGDWAFDGCSGLTSITIPNSVTSIGDWAFDGCSGLTSITIPNSVTSIGYHAFDRCSSLEKISIPFSGVSKDDFHFGHILGLKYKEPFADSKKISESIPSSLKSVIITGGSEIRAKAFRDCCNLTSITILSSVTTIGDNAFEGCSGLTSITIPNSVTTIGDNAFEGCSGLTSITIPNSVTSIGCGAFYYCDRLTSITCPKSLKKQMKGAMYKWQYKTINFTFTK